MTAWAAVGVAALILLLAIVRLCADRAQRARGLAFKASAFDRYDRQRSALRRLAELDARVQGALDARRSNVDALVGSESKSASASEGRERLVWRRVDIEGSRSTVSRMDRTISGYLRERGPLADEAAGTE